MNYLCHEEGEGEKQLYLKPEVFTLKIAMLVLYHCIFLLRIHLLVYQVYKHFMKRSFIRRAREQVKIRNNHMEIMLDSSLSILEMIGTVMQLCKGIPSSFSSFF